MLITFVDDKSVLFFGGGGDFFHAGWVTLRISSFNIEYPAVWTGNAESN